MKANNDNVRIDVYIIVPVFKRLQQTKSLYESLVQSLDNFILIIGDDSPDFEHVSYFQDHKNVTVIKGTGDLWWGGTINLCLDYLNNIINPESTDVIILANNDTIIETNTFKIIQAKLKENPLAIHHPRVFNMKNKEIQSGARLLSWAPIRCKYPIAFSQELAKVDMMTGRFLVMYYNVLDKIGYIAPNLPHYAGDNDFSLRAKKMGIPSYLVRDSKCYIDEKATGIKLKPSMSLSTYFKALTDIKSPLNMKYKYTLIRNHNSLPFSLFAISIEFAKSFLKYFQNKIS